MRRPPPSTNATTGLIGRYLGTLSNAEKRQAFQGLSQPGAMCETLRDSVWYRLTTITGRELAPGKLEIHARWDDYPADYPVGFPVGSTVQAKADDWTSWYEGVVAKASFSSALNIHVYTVTFGDGDVEEGLTSEQVRRAEWMALKNLVIGQKNHALAATRATSIVRSFAMHCGRDPSKVELEKMLREVHEKHANKMKYVDEDVETAQDIVTERFTQAKGRGPSPSELLAIMTKLETRHGKSDLGASLKKRTKKVSAHERDVSQAFEIRRGRQPTGVEVKDILVHLGQARRADMELQRAQDDILARFRKVHDREPRVEEAQTFMSRFMARQQTLHDDAMARRDAGRAKIAATEVDLRQAERQRDQELQDGIRMLEAHKQKVDAAIRNLDTAATAASAAAREENGRGHGAVTAAVQDQARRRAALRASVEAKVKKLAAMVEASNAALGQRKSARQQARVEVEAVKREGKAQRREAVSKSKALLAAPRASLTEATYALALLGFVKNEAEAEAVAMERIEKQQWKPWHRAEAATVLKFTFEARAKAGAEAAAGADGAQKGKKKQQQSPGPVVSDATLASIAVTLYLAAFEAAAVESVVRAHVREEKLMEEIAFGKVFRLLTAVLDEWGITSFPDLTAARAQSPLADTLRTSEGKTANHSTKGQQQRGLGGQKEYRGLATSLNGLLSSALKSVFHDPAPADPAGKDDSSASPNAGASAATAEAITEAATATAATTMTTSEVDAEQDSIAVRSAAAAAGRRPLDTPASSLLGQLGIDRSTILKRKQNKEEIKSKDASVAATMEKARHLLFNDSARTIQHAGSRAKKRRLERRISATKVQSLYRGRRTRMRMARKRRERVKLRGVSPRLSLDRRRMRKPPTPSTPPPGVGAAFQFPARAATPTTPSGFRWSIRPSSAAKVLSETGAMAIGWETHLDEASGLLYYFNPGTGESLWGPPAAVCFRGRLGRPHSQAGAAAATAAAAAAVVVQQQDWRRIKLLQTTLCSVAVKSDESTLSPPPQQQQPVLRADVKPQPPPVLLPLSMLRRGLGSAGGRPSSRQRATTTPSLDAVKETPESRPAGEGEFDGSGGGTGSVTGVRRISSRGGSRGGSRGDMVGLTFQEWTAMRTLSRGGKPGTGNARLGTPLTALPSEGQAQMLEFDGGFLRPEDNDEDEKDEDKDDDDDFPSDPFHAIRMRQRKRENENGRTEAEMNRGGNERRVHVFRNIDGDIEMDGDEEDETFFANVMSSLRRELGSAVGDQMAQRPLNLSPLTLHTEWEDAREEAAGGGREGGRKQQQQLQQQQTQQSSSRQKRRPPRRRRRRRRRRKQGENGEGGGGGVTPIQSLKRELHGVLRKVSILAGDTVRTVKQPSRVARRWKAPPRSRAAERQARAKALTEERKAIAARVADRRRRAEQRALRKTMVHEYRLKKRLRREGAQPGILDYLRIQAKDIDMYDELLETRYQNAMKKKKADLPPGALVWPGGENDTNTTLHRFDGAAARMRQWEMERDYERLRKRKAERLKKGVKGIHSSLAADEERKRDSSRGLLGRIERGGGKKGLRRRSGRSESRAGTGSAQHRAGTAQTGRVSTARTLHMAAGPDSRGGIGGGGRARQGLGSAGAAFMDDMRDLEVSLYMRNRAGARAAAEAKARAEAAQRHRETAAYREERAWRETEDGRVHVWSIFSDVVIRFAQRIANDEVWIAWLRWQFFVRGIRFAEQQREDLRGIKLLTEWSTNHDHGGKLTTDSCSRGEAAAMEPEVDDDAGDASIREPSTARTGKRGRSRRTDRSGAPSVVSLQALAAQQAAKREKAADHGVWSVLL